MVGRKSRVASQTLSWISSGFWQPSYKSHISDSGRNFWNSEDQHLQKFCNSLMSKIMEYNHQGFASAQIFVRSARFVEGAQWPVRFVGKKLACFAQIGSRPTANAPQKHQKTANILRLPQKCPKKTKRIGICGLEENNLTTGSHRNNGRRNCRKNDSRPEFVRWLIFSVGGSKYLAASVVNTSWNCLWGIFVGENSLASRCQLAKRQGGCIMRLRSAAKSTSFARYSQTLAKYSKT